VIFSHIRGNFSIEIYYMFETTKFIDTKVTCFVLADIIIANQDHC